MGGYSIYIDGAPMLTKRLRVSGRQLAALSQVCRLCGGMCCKGFRLSGLGRADDGGVSWEAWKEHAERSKLKRVRRVIVRNMNFAKRHFIVRDIQPHAGQASFDCGCQLPNGLCGAYRSRPPLCRGFVCASAWFKGTPPDMDFQTMECQAEGGDTAGVVPLQVTLTSWVDEVLPRLRRERRLNGGLAVGEPRRLRDFDPGAEPALLKSGYADGARRLHEPGRRGFGNSGCWAEDGGTAEADACAAE